MREHFHNEHMVSTAELEGSKDNPIVRARERLTRDLGIRLVEYLRKHPREWQLVRMSAPDVIQRFDINAITLADHISVLPLAEFHTLVE